MVLSQSFIRLQSRFCPEVQTFDTRQARGYAPQTVHLQVLQVSAACWQEALVLYHMNLSIGLIKCPHDMTAGDPRDTKVVAEHVFYDLVLEATLVIFTVFFWCPRSALFNVQRNYQGCKYHEDHGKPCGDYHKYLQPCST